MKNLTCIKQGAITLSLQPYKQMPKADKTPTGYTLKVGETELKHPQVMLTGGGVHPAYTYINDTNGIRWFAGHFASGTAVEVIDPTLAVAAAVVAENSPAGTPGSEQATKVEAPKPTSKSNKK